MTRSARELGVSKLKNAPRQTVHYGLTGLNQIQERKGMGMKEIDKTVMSYREVARRLGMSATNVRKIEQRALKKLRLQGKLDGWREGYEKSNSSLS